MLKTQNPHRKPHIALSDCCNATVSVIPACFGDPEFHICKNCTKGCTYQWKPVYEKVSKGTFRLIEYKLKK